jgi:hypothetical protein
MTGSKTALGLGFFLSFLSFLPLTGFGSCLDCLDAYDFGFSVASVFN